VRNVFLGLLFANLAYYGWSQWVAAPPPPPVNETITRLPRLKLEGEATPRQKQPPNAATRTAVNDPSTCLSVGPFADLGNRARAVALLRAKGFDAHERVEGGGASGEYWVDLSAEPAVKPVPLTDLFAEGVSSRVSVQPCPGSSQPSVTSEIEVTARRRTAAASTPTAQNAVTPKLR